MGVFEWYDSLFCKNCRENIERMELGYNPKPISCLSPKKCKILEIISWIFALPFLFLLLIIMIPLLGIAIISNILHEKKI